MSDLLASSLPELNQLALKSLENKLPPDSSLTDHLSMCRYLLKQASQYRKARDGERTYMCLIMYLAIVVRRFSDDDIMIGASRAQYGEVNYNREKVPQIRQEVEKFKTYLEGLYDEDLQQSDDEIPTQSYDQEEYTYEQQPDEEEQLDEEEQFVGDTRFIGGDEQFVDESTLGPRQDVRQKTNLQSKPTTSPPKPTIPVYKKPKKIRPLPGMGGEPMLPTSQSTSQGKSQTASQGKSQTASQGKSQTASQGKQPSGNVTKTMSKSNNQLNSQINQYFSEETNSRLVDRGMERVAMNSHVQRQIGKGVSSMAQDERVQKQVGDGLGRFAKNQKLQSQFGEAIASSSDNRFVQSLARNQKVQQSVGNALHRVATNEAIQKQTAKTITKVANDKEFQKKAAKGGLSVAKMGLRAGMFGGKSMLRTGAKLYQSSRDESNPDEED